MMSRLTFLLTISFITLINAQWYRQELPAVPLPFYSVHFEDDQTGWAAGKYGITLKTTNGGINWYAEAHPSTIGGDIYSIFFVSQNKGWAVGNGTILSTIDGGDIYTSTSPINEYSLSQNYPNPFNPVTNIKYAIPSELKNEKVQVKLSIFDMLGSEVAVLVN